MARNYPDWLSAYCEYTQHLESPAPFHFFSGIAAVAGALGRKVWFDQGFFKWYPNFYILFVAKPGIAAKSTTINAAMDLLRDVPGIHFGPSSLTWQALVQHMSGITEQVEIDGELHTMSCMIFAASELGVFLDFKNREMIDVLVDLWDGKAGSWEKLTKSSGMETIVNPLISFTAGVTPAWLAANVPESAVGGGFTSRCIFVHGERKRQLTAYIKKRINVAKHSDMRAKLVADLESISLIKGEYTLTVEAEKWGEQWYEQLWNNTPKHLRNERFEGYVARKQTHLHKCAMVFAAAKRDERTITIEDMQYAEAILTGAERDMSIALSSIGKAQSAIWLDILLAFIHENGSATPTDCHAHLARYCDMQTAVNVFNQATASGFTTNQQNGNNAAVVLTPAGRALFTGQRSD